MMDEDLGRENLDAELVELQAAEWAADCHNAKDWSPQRQTDLEAWLAKSIAHRVAYLRIDASWKRADRLAALRRPMREGVGRVPSRKVFWTRIATALGLAIVSGVFASSYFTRPRGQLVETPAGGQERLTLADGTQIELNTNTAVRIDFSAHSRAVALLRGEAVFQVRHDATRPFVVSVADHRIEDIGTKFLVRMAPKSFQIALLEGSARLTSNNSGAGQHPMVLSPGDVAVATANSTQIMRKTQRELSDRVAWQHGSIVFHNERLADALAEFNRYGGPRLVLTDNSAAKLKINGTFRTNGAEDFAAITHEIFGLLVNHQDGTIVLSR